ncbi:MAG: hypothetical protein ACXABY_28940, partial [Candidatus Thorarchaeota archaeon]
MTDRNKLLALDKKYPDLTVWMTLEEVFFIHYTLRLTKCVEYYECGTCYGWSALWAASALMENQKFFPDLNIALHT